MCIICECACVCTNIEFDFFLLALDLKNETTFTLRIIIHFLSSLSLSNIVKNRTYSFKKYEGNFQFNVFEEGFQG